MAGLSSISSTEIDGMGEAGVRSTGKRVGNINDHDSVAKGEISRMPVSEVEQQTQQSNMDIEKSAFDFIIATVQSLLSRMVLPSVESYNTERVLSDQEIDQLAKSSFDMHSKELKQYAEEVAPDDSKFLQLRSLLEDEDHLEWEMRCRKLMKASVLQSPMIKQLENYRSKLRAYLGSWSQTPGHCSPNIYLLDDQLTAHRVPKADQTDAIRGKIGVRHGKHCWDIKISGPVGTHCSVGIAMGEAPLMSSAYTSLIGANEHSYGWDLVWGNLIHDGKVYGNYPPKHIYDYTPGDTIRIFLDCDNGTLAFAVNECTFGTAFDNIANKKQGKYYPSISLVYGNVEASMVYLGPNTGPLRNNDEKISGKQD